MGLYMGNKKQIILFKGRKIKNELFHQKAERDDHIIRTSYG